MDLETTVAASMLPASRSRVAAAFADLRQELGSGPAFLELLWSASGKSDVLGAGAIQALLDAAAAAIAAAPALGVEPIAIGDSRYPHLLARIPDPPPVLWAKGRLEVLSRPSVAVVGSRAATPYALEVAARLAGELADRGVVVASGLARGVDSSAHRGCLKAGGATIAVLGCGIDRVYPPEHDELSAEIAKTGLLLAELAPGAVPLPEHFPLRNRIISGISLAAVIVEASERSGSLITARCALEQGREVMAVPGSVLSGRNRGSHALLKDGAKIVETADDILGELGWALPEPPASSSKALTEEPLLAAMEPAVAYGLDDLVARAGGDASSLLARLTALELEGRVRVVGAKFVRCG